MSIEAPDPARGLRRLLVVGLLLALTGAGVALGVFLTRSSGVSLPAIFPARFAERGFVSGPVRLDHSFAAAGPQSRLTGALPAGTTSYIVARCDHGGIVVTAGSVTTSQPCTGRPEGVLNLKAGRPTTLTATVTEPQTGRWGLAIYR
jgi:hypothetical protein